MKKNQYLAQVQAYFVAGWVDAQTGKSPNPAKYPAEFAGAYAAGYDLVAVRTLAEPAVMTTASQGFDDGFTKAAMRAPAYPSQIVLDTKGTSDFMAVYVNAYTAGLFEATQPSPPPIPVPVTPETKPPEPVPPSPDLSKIPPAAPVDSDNTLLIVGGLGLIAASIGAGYLASKYKERRPHMATANPSKNINPGHVWLQGVGWVKGKPAGDLRVGDIMKWNYGYSSTVETIEQVSPQFVVVRERLQDGKLYDRRMKIDRLVAIGR